jgi:hypothetical protein
MIWNDDNEVEFINWSEVIEVEPDEMESLVEYRLPVMLMLAARKAYPKEEICSEAPPAASGGS